jgi:UDP-N-acetyl-2-amino-2-deoxyglucuronate dehydrogenase
MTVSPLGVGIVGLGQIARSHTQGFKSVGDKARLVGYYDIDPNRTTLYIRQQGGKVFDSLRNLVEDPEIDIVDLILPHQFHHEAAMLALNAGKHLIMEKPIANSYREGMEICEKADKAGVHFMVAENTRFVKGYMAAEKIIRDGTIGEINHIHTYLRSNEKYRLALPNFWGRKYETGGGLILDCGPHSFYLLKWLFGSFREVLAYTSQVFPIPGAEVEDAAEALGRLSNNAHFSCGFTSTAEIPHSERLEVHGTKGGLIVDQMADPVVKVFKSMMDFKGTAVEGVPFGPSGWMPGGWHFDSVVTEVAEYVNSIIENRPVPIDPLDTVYAIKVIEKAYQSARTGKVVPID